LGGAGIRLGYLLGTVEIVSEINKIKLPYNINFFTEYIASEFLAHKDLIRNNISLILKQRKVVFDFLKTLPFENVYPTHANFILIRTEDKDSLFSYLKKNDILVRDVSSYPMLENCLRISIGSEEENKILMETITMFYS
jgi:histidinol-phosphate aminotransferase